MGLCGIGLWFFAPQIIGLYLDPARPENRGVIDLAVTFLRIGAAFQLFDTAQVVASLSLRGLKDADFPMWIAGASYWLVGTPLAWYLAFHREMQGAGVWVAFVVALLVAALAMSVRFIHLAEVDWRGAFKRPSIPAS
jgi:MATE family multidrug resistance protein